MTTPEKENDKELVATVSGLLGKHFNLDFPENQSWVTLRKSLINFLNSLLDNDMERLLQGLYRIDVSERKVKKILYEEDSQKIAGSLADLIIERQMQKAITRRQYRKE